MYLYLPSPCYRVKIVWWIKVTIVTWQLFWSLPTLVQQKKTPPLYRKALAWKVSPAPCDISVHDYGIPQWVKDCTLLNVNPTDLFTANIHSMKFRDVPWYSMNSDGIWNLNLFFNVTWLDSGSHSSWELLVHLMQKDFTLLDSVKHTWCRPHPKKTNKHLFPGAFAEEVKIPPISSRGSLDLP